MGKGKRAHLDYKPPLSSADTLKSIDDTLPAIYNDSTLKQVDSEKPPLVHIITTYLSYLVLIVVGHIRDFIKRIVDPKQFKQFTNQNGYAAIQNGFGHYY